MKDVESEVEELLEEIGHKMMLPAVRTLALIIRMTLRNVLRGVYVNMGGLERVRRRISKNGQLCYIANFVCYLRNIPLNLCMT